MIRIDITITDEGQLQFNGPLHDKVLCLGVLEMAKHAVISHVPSKIVTPGGVVQSLRAISGKSN